MFLPTTLPQVEADGGVSVEAVGAPITLPAAQMACVGSIDPTTTAAETYVAVAYKPNCITPPVLAKAAEFLARFAAEPLPFALYERRDERKEEVRIEERYFSRPLQSARFRRNIKAGPNAPDPKRGKYQGCLRRVAFGAAPEGVAEGAYAGPSDEFVEWLDNFIPCPARSPEERAADALPAVLPGGGPAANPYIETLLGLMELSFDLKITPLFDLCTMRWATLFRKAGGEGAEEPTSFLVNKRQMRFGDPALGIDLGRAECDAHFGTADDYTQEEKEALFLEEKWLCDAR